MAISMERAMDKAANLDRQAISKRVRGLVWKHLEMGLSEDTRIMCHNCGHAKSVLGTAYYGRYRLCNDCTLQYEVAKAKGDIQTIEDFVLAD
jgi:hypothetical protein